ncbi:ASCH domain-containing protein [Tardiphaga alba]|uniref:ASCH domain-containing protein n=1 Tax=Tardiphaga alba TaxID=340268 RepID=A0ABX8A3B2_9BRAD|nr:ASCH domain-containing protein [Tardiphaga alba]
MRHIVISIQPKWAGLIRSGRKTIELRRRFPRLPAGSLAYLYESSPVCSLTALLTICAVHELSVSELWNVYGGHSCVDEAHFASYFEGRDVGYGVQIADCVSLPNAIPLAQLREQFAFTAPQSWAYASPKLVSSGGIAK